MGAQKTNYDREFCYRYDYRPNWTPLSFLTSTEQGIIKADDSSLLREVVRMERSTCRNYMCNYLP